MSTDSGAIQSQHAIDANEPFKSITWVMHSDGSIHHVKAPSRKKVVATLRDAAASGKAVACASAYFPFGSVKGLFSVDVEESGRPRAEVISLVEGGVVGSPRYHLHEPEIFQAAAADA